MNYLHFDLGQVSGGTAVQVTLQGVESDVFLVDSTNYAQFRRGGNYSYVGGHYNQSPVVLQVPSAGNWTAVVVPVGGTVNASVRII